MTDSTTLVNNLLTTGLTDKTPFGEKAYLFELDTDGKFSEVTGFTAFCRWVIYSLFCCFYKNSTAKNDLYNKTITLLKGCGKLDEEKVQKLNGFGSVDVKIIELSTILTAPTPSTGTSIQAVDLTQQSKPTVTTSSPTAPNSPDLQLTSLPPPPPPPPPAPAPTAVPASALPATDPQPVSNPPSTPPSLVAPIHTPPAPSPVDQPKREEIPSAPPASTIVTTAVTTSTTGQTALKGITPPGTGMTTAAATVASTASSTLSSTASSSKPSQPKASSLSSSLKASSSSSSAPSALDLERQANGGLTAAEALDRLLAGTRGISSPVPFSSSHSLSSTPTYRSGISSSSASSSGSELDREAALNGGMSGVDAIAMLTAQGLTGTSARSTSSSSRSTSPTPVSAPEPDLPPRKYDLFGGITYDLEVLKSNRTQQNSKAVINSILSGITQFLNAKEIKLFEAITLLHKLVQDEKIFIPHFVIPPSGESAQAADERLNQEPYNIVFALLEKHINQLIKRQTEQLGKIREELKAKLATNASDPEIATMIRPQLKAALLSFINEMPYYEVREIRNSSRKRARSTDTSTDSLKEWIEKCIRTRREIVKELNGYYTNDKEPLVSEFLNRGERMCIGSLMRRLVNSNPEEDITECQEVITNCNNTIRSYQTKYGIFLDVQNNILELKILREEIDQLSVRIAALEVEDNGEEETPPPVTDTEKEDASWGVDDADAWDDEEEAGAPKTRKPPAGKKPASETPVSTPTVGAEESAKATALLATWNERLAAIKSMLETEKAAACEALNKEFDGNAHLFNSISKAEFRALRIEVRNLIKPTAAKKPVVAPPPASRGTVPASTSSSSSSLSSARPPGRPIPPPKRQALPTKPSSSTTGGAWASASDEQDQATTTTATATAATSAPPASRGAGASRINSRLISGAAPKREESKAEKPPEPQPPPAT